MKVNDNQYDLYMRVDTNTRGHRQWFYFSVRSKVKKLIRLNIYRFKKQLSLFQRGMKPYVRSVKSKQDWKPAGVNVRYVREKENNQYGVKKGSIYFYLTFQYQFQNNQDQVYFAAGIPYTYSFMQERILHFQQKSKQLQQLNFQIILAGKSMCGLDVKIIKIQHCQTAHISEGTHKRIIALNSRTHSGQTSASWVLDGILDILTSGHDILLWMKKFNICFYIIPILNVDGALMGNYRTGIIGEDFNRKFHSGRKGIFPQIYYLKKMISNAKKQGNILMFMDLHGHSILKNSFIYGPSETDFQQCLLKKLPFYMWHKSKYFKISSCKFKTQRDKIQTARMYFQIRQDLLSFTCENSLGMYAANQQNFQMTKEDWQKFGVGIIEAIKATVQSQRQAKKEQGVLPNDCFMKQDLRKTQTPPKKQKDGLQSASRSIQIPKFMHRSKKQMQVKRNCQGNSNETKKIQITLKTFKNKEWKNMEQRNVLSKAGKQTSKLQQKEQKSIEIKTRLNQIHKRFPSLTTKQLKSNETISYYLKAASKQERQKVITNVVQRNKTQDVYRKKMLQNSAGSTKNKVITQKQLKIFDDQTIEKKQFLESTYNKKQLKELKIKQRREHGYLGRDLVSFEQTKRKIEQKKTKLNQPPNLNYDISPKQKKYSCDIDSLTQNMIEINDMDISLKDVRPQRSLTFDQSYLASQINRLREMKQTQRQYHEDDNMNVEGWINTSDNMQQMVTFDDNFSQKFDDSINDQDSGSQDLPQQDRNHVLDYIRSHQNARRDKMFCSSQSQSDRDIEQKTQQIQRDITSSPMNHKKLIHGFRQIVFKSALYDNQQKKQNNEMNKGGNSYAANTKIRKNPHKFKQSLSVIKYKSMSRKIQLQEQDTSGINIIHKLMLNQRSLKRQSRKDPFVLLSVKDKFGGKFY